MSRNWRKHHHHPPAAYADPPREVVVEKHEHREEEHHTLPRFKMDCGGKGNEVYLAFRKLATDTPEHWVNRWAAWLTRTKDDTFPGGHLCHVELFMRPNEHEVYTFSINKKEGVQDSEGKITFTEPGVHGRPLENLSEIKKYALVSIPISRKKQAAAWQFFRAQLGAPFNKPAYYFNGIFAFLPWKLGKKGLNPDMLNIGHLHKQRRRYTWFCTELLTVALHVMDVNAFLIVRPSHSNPNSHWRAVSGPSSGFSLVRLTDTLKVEDL